MNELFVLESNDQMTMCRQLAKSLKISVFGNLHPNKNSYMYFTSVLILPAFIPVTNMTYDKASPIHLDIGVECIVSCWDDTYSRDTHIYASSVLMHIEI